MTDPTFTAAPSVIPSRSAPSTFSALTDPFLVWEKTFRGELSTSVSWFALQVTNAGQAVIDAQAEVVLAADQVTLATAQKDEATAQAVLAASSAAAAIVTTNAAAWVSEASYTALDNAISGVDFGTYRAILTHTGETTDPSADETNWVLIGFIGKASQAQAEAGTDNSNGMTPLRTSQAIDELSPRLSTVATTGATQSIDFGSNKVITSAANAATVTYSFDNPVGVAKVDLVIDYQALTGYSLASAFYENLSFSVRSQEANPSSLFFKSDGTKMYVIGTSNAVVYQYSLSTPWVISSASYDSVSFSVEFLDNDITGLFFKPDGTEMYVIGQERGRVSQYSLSTAWVVSSASYDDYFSVTWEATTPVGLFFKPDGTKMYVVNRGSYRVYQYSLSTPWVISSASYDSVELAVFSQDSRPQGLFFKPDGTKMYVVGSSNDRVYQYSLSTPWVISSASYDSVSFSVNSEGPSPNGLFFKSDGSKMYVVGSSSDSVHQYFSADIPTLVFPGTMESVTIPLKVYEKTAVTIVTADSGASYQVISILGGIV